MNYNLGKGEMVRCWRSQAVLRAPQAVEVLEMNNATRTSLLRKIAKMEIMGVPRAQIADSVSVSESYLSQLIKDDDEYSQISQQLATEEFDKLDTLNNGWDKVETLSVTQLLDHLTTVPDPDFALRAAAMANKAQRRGLYNKPITPTDGQRTARISLNATFVDKLQQVTVNAPAAAAAPAAQNNKYGFKPAPALTNGCEGDEPLPNELMKKDTNFLNPSAVHKLLDSDGGQSTGSRILNALDEYGISDAIPQLG